ncbi:MAG: phosphoribosylformylglycinamidine cyclo-ligase [Deltaproteobacteria bacterium]|jgi:phosphoribosylformylglycinamidine cyclo-ligase|nr:phosphoribosylformylglycinamidine cyclo-ligase [Deltaproteobacteria bacterium]
MSVSSNSSKDRAKAYTSSGVNINSGYELVQRIKEMVKTTRTQGVVSDIGGFGGLFKPDLKGMEDPILVASTDGVGTKLKLAFAFNRHNTVGIDLVAMSVNDIIVQGAKPLFFLDYFACGQLAVDVAAQVVSGVAEGCRQAGCALLGGETAEMPGMYADGEYDLAGFCVGLADNANLVDGSSIGVGDAIIGLASSGLHSNGYSLARKLLDKSGLRGDAPFPGLPGESVADVLLKPTTIYAEIIRNLMRDFPIKGMANITGGGFYENIPRALSSQVAAEIDFSTWPKSPLFAWLKARGELEWTEMLQIFNCGIGYVLIVGHQEAEEVIARLTALQCPAWQIGSIRKRTDGEEEQVSIKF